MATEKSGARSALAEDFLDTNRHEPLRRTTPTDNDGADGTGGTDAETADDDATVRPAEAAASPASLAVLRWCTGNNSW